MGEGFFGIYFSRPSLMASPTNWSRQKRILGFAIYFSEGTSVCSDTLKTAFTARRGIRDLGTIPASGVLVKDQHSCIRLHSSEVEVGHWCFEDISTGYLCFSSQLGGKGAERER
jgi:hypothetical protein